MRGIEGIGYGLLFSAIVIGVFWFIVYLFTGDVSWLCKFRGAL